jgi:hypothetical protein
MSKKVEIEVGGKRLTVSNLGRKTMSVAPACVGENYGSALTPQSRKDRLLHDE